MFWDTTLISFSFSFFSLDSEPPTAKPGAWLPDSHTFKNHSPREGLSRFARAYRGPSLGRFINNLYKIVKPQKKFREAARVFSSSEYDVSAGATPARLDGKQEPLITKRVP